MVKVIIPPPYQGPTQGEAEIWVEGTTIQECLNAVAARFPGFGELIYNTDGQLPHFVRVFVNGTLIDADVLGAQVAMDDEISVLAAIAGG
jgi:molybdopterin converting factor small subunit